MDARRMTVWIGLIVVLVGVGVLAYFNVRDRAQDPAVTTAATQSEEATPSEPDGEVAATPSDDAAAAGVVDGTSDDADPVVAAADVDATEPDAPAVAPPELVTSLEDQERDIEIAEGASPDPAAGPEETAEAATEVAPSESPDIAAQADDAAVTPDVADETDVAALPEADEPSVAAEPVEDTAETAMVSPDPEPAPPKADEPTGDAPAEAEALATDGAPVEGSPAPLVPSFDIVRVEPTGDAVIAGQAEPGAMVELMRGDEPIATAEANERGEWALALLEPLPPGSHDLSVRTTSPDESTVALSDQRIAVMVPESADEEPLVVLASPDAPSTIVQLPDVAPEAPAPEETVVAAAPVAAAPADGEPTAVASEADAIEPEVMPAPETETAEAAPPADEATGVADEAEVALAEAPPSTPSGSGTPDGATPEVETAEPAPEGEGEGEGAAASDSGQPPKPDAVTAEQDVAAADPVGEQPAEPEAMSPEGDVAADEPATEPPAEPDEPTAEVAAVEPAPEPEPEPVVVPEVVVTAVEAETTGALFIAGTAATDQSVRVYMDDKLLGEAKPSPSGTWLLQADRDLPAGTYTVRADQVEAASGNVLARAEVPFERDVEVAVLTPVGDTSGDTGATATGSLGELQTVIIKRRDNLWRISRRIYGQGIRWSTIYDANKDQIRNPRWIFPGQVFLLPKGNTAWEEDEPADDTPG